MVCFVESVFLLAIHLIVFTRKSIRCGEGVLGALGLSDSVVGRRWVVGAIGVVDLLWFGLVWNVG